MEAQLNWDFHFPTQTDYSIKIRDRERERGREREREREGEREWHVYRLRQELENAEPQLKLGQSIFFPPSKYQKQVRKGGRRR